MFLQRRIFKALCLFKTFSAGHIARSFYRAIDGIRTKRVQGTMGDLEGIEHVGASYSCFFNIGSYVLNQNLFSERYNLKLIAFKVEPVLDRNQELCRSPLSTRHRCRRRLAFVLQDGMSTKAVAWSNPQVDDQQKLESNHT